jgi:hypothetical protein
VSITSAAGQDVTEEFMTIRERPNLILSWSPCC